MTLREPSWPDARAAARCATPLPEITVVLAAADRHVLAADAVARTDLPGFDTSAMDGWAVCGPGPWSVAGEVLAGGAPAVTLQPGQACVIATGAAVPVGTTAVVRREHGTLAADLLHASVTPGAEVRPAGEECRDGDVLATCGSTVGPALIGLLSAAGLDEVRVRRPPRVAIVLFGDELLTSGVAGVGRVRDSLGPQLPGWLQRLGATVAGVSRAADTLADHVEAIAAAAVGADVVVTTGGTAAGPVDHLHPAVAALGGSFIVDAVAVRPGHPMALADLAPGGGGSGRAGWLLALPGNPHSAVVSLMTLGAPLLDSLLGRPAAAPAGATMAESATAPPHEHRLLACRLVDGRAVPVAHLGSAMLRGLAAADGFAVLPPGGAGAGQQVVWLPLPC